MKNKRISIFWKFFVSALLVLVLMILTAYLLLYFLLPEFYGRYKENQCRESLTEVTEKAGAAASLAEETEILREFAVQNGVDLILQDADGNLLYDYYRDSRIVTDIDSSAQKESEISVELKGDSGESLAVEESYTALGEQRHLIVSVPLQPLNEAKNVIADIYPLACAICVLCALLLAFLLSAVYVRPIRRIGKQTKKMAALEEGALIPAATQDEIGDLSRDINQLYTSLKGTIDALKAEIDKSSDAENRKLDFLRTVSHELKNPLASANALLQAIIYEVPPYDKNQKEYLQECSEMLEKAIRLVRESLTLSKEEYREPEEEFELGEMIGEILRGYQIILQSKQVTCRNSIDGEIRLRTRKNLLEKALSNILSNAVTYTPPGGEIRLYLQPQSPSGQSLIIENTCRPLTPEDLEKAFQPFHTCHSQAKTSNGLGLYIVSQLFALLHITYQFTAIEDGMRFTIDLPKKYLKKM